MGRQCGLAWVIANRWHYLSVDKRSQRTHPRFTWPVATHHRVGPIHRAAGLLTRGACGSSRTTAERKDMVFAICSLEGRCISFSFCSASPRSAGALRIWRVCALLVPPHPHIRGLRASHIQSTPSSHAGRSFAARAPVASVTARSRAPEAETVVHAAAPVDDSFGFKEAQRSSSAVQ